MIDLCLLRQFLGLEIEQSEAGIKVNQPKYDAGLLLKFIMEKFKASVEPHFVTIFW